jgi:hypothetical protein
MPITGLILSLTLVQSFFGHCTNKLSWYGFYDECKRRYNIKLWKTLTDYFNTLLLVAIISNKVLCLHGGLSLDLLLMEQIRRITRLTNVNSSFTASITVLIRFLNYRYQLAARSSLG